MHWEGRRVIKLWREVWTASRGSHLYVASWSICDRDWDFWSAKSALDWLIVPSEALDCLVFNESKVKLQPLFWSLEFCSSGYLDPLISSQKSLWFNFDLSHKHGTYKWLPLVHVTMMVCRCLLGIPRLRLKTKWVKLAVCGHQNNDQRVVSGQLTDCSGYEKSLWLRSKWPTSSNLGIQSLGSSVSPLYAKLTWPDILHSAGAQDQVPIFSYEAQ